MYSLDFEFALRAVTVVRPREAAGRAFACHVPCQAAGMRANARSLCVLRMRGLVQRCTVDVLFRGVAMALSAGRRSVRPARHGGGEQARKAHPAAGLRGQRGGHGRRAEQRQTQCRGRATGRSAADGSVEAAARAGRRREAAPAGVPGGLVEMAAE